MADHALARLTKKVAVQRSNRVPTLYWWSLPLRLRDAASLYADVTTGARALIHPASALGDEASALGARSAPGGTAWVTDVRGLLLARDEGRVGPCSIAVFPPTIRDDEVEPRLTRFHDDLEQLGFTIALIPEGDGSARHRYCFRVPGKVILALKHLAHGRSFGGNPGQVEMALLNGLQLRPKQVAYLRLVLEDGGVQLLGEDSAGERLRETWRRFPIGVVMFTGLPFFIAVFWLHSLMTRRGMPRPTH